MTFKKKMLIAISILSVMLFASISGLIIALVLNSKVATSQVDVRYSSSKVDVTLSANYSINGAKTAMLDPYGKDSIDLNLENDLGTLNPDSVIKLDSNTQQIIFEFIISNNSTNVGVVVDLYSSPVADNMKVGYYYAEQEITDFAGIYPATEYFPQYIHNSASKDRYIYMIIDVVDPYDVASYVGTFEWDLHRTGLVKPEGYSKDVIVFNSDGITPKAEYNTIEEAMNGDANGVLGYTHGDVIKLYNNQTTDTALFAFKDVTVDGQGIFSVKPAYDFTSKQLGTTNYISKNSIKSWTTQVWQSLFVCGPRELRHNTSDATSTALTEAQQADVRDYIGMTLTLKDILLNGDYRVHGVLGYGGRLIIDGAFINFGRGTEGYGSTWGHGLYFSNQTVCVMYDGNVTGNYQGDKSTPLREYTSDAYWGSEVYFEFYGGTIGKATMYAGSNTGLEQEQVPGLADVVGDGEQNKLFYKGQVRMFGGNFEGLMLWRALVGEGENAIEKKAYIEYAGGSFSKLLAWDGESANEITNKSVGTIYQGGSTDTTKGTFDINTLAKNFAKA